MIDAGHGRRATLYSSMAKRFAADTAMEVTTDAGLTGIAEPSRH